MVLLSLSLAAKKKIRLSHQSAAGLAVTIGCMDIKDVILFNEVKLQSDLLNLDPRSCP